MTDAAAANPVLTQWGQYQWTTLNKPHLTNDDIEPVIETLAARPRITHKRIGESFNGIAIHRLSIGNGPLTLLAWTQMHGDEPTATAAVLDLLAMLSAPACDDLLADNWLAQITLHVIPMLNPDGALQGSRENAQGIDINRDARALQTPEGRLLDQQVSELRPDIGFNLHDQSRYYAAGNSKKPATLSFLAPPFNIAGEIDSTRLRAKQLIAAMHQAVAPLRPGQFGRYDDTYAHRCFGDTLAARGVSTILIESGADYHDPHRQSARGLNVVALYTAIHALLSLSYEAFKVSDYLQIHENREDGLCDVLLRHLSQQTEAGDTYWCDVAISHSQTFGKQAAPTVSATGDLSDTGAFQEIDCSAYRLTALKPFTVTAPLILTDQTYLTHIQAGYSHYLDEQGLLRIETDWPVYITHHALAHSTPSLLPGSAVCLPLLRDSGDRALVVGTRWLGNL